MNNTYAKDTPSPPVDVRQISFYNFIGRVCKGPNQMPLHRVCTLMRKMNAKWLIEEELEESWELAKEFRAIKERCGERAECAAKRYTFFLDMAGGDWRKRGTGKKLLAYLVVVTIGFPRQHFIVQVRGKAVGIKNRAYIYEAVVAFPAKDLELEGGSCVRVPITNYYYHCGDTFKTMIGTNGDHKKFTVDGTYFAQQNNLTSVCAHACTQMAINNSPVLKRERRKRKVTSERINNILHIDHADPKKWVGEFELDPKTQTGRG